MSADLCSLSLSRSLSHCMSPSRSSFFLSKAGAGPDRQETQPFRTKWTSNVKNWGKIAILRCRFQPFRTKWTSNVKNWGKIAILRCRFQPFRTKWTSNVKNWGKIAILRCRFQLFRAKWTSNVKNCGKIAILRCRFQLFRAKWTSNVKNCGKIAIFKFCGDPFARNGRGTSKTEEKLRFFSQIWTLSHEMDVERQKLRKNYVSFYKFEPFRTKRTSNVKNWGKITLFLSNFELPCAKWTLNIQKACVSPFEFLGRRCEQAL